MEGCSMPPRQVTSLPQDATDEVGETNGNSTPSIASSDGNPLKKKAKDIIKLSKKKYKKKKHKKHE